jgi:hypothetical protein
VLEKAAAAAVETVDLPHSGDDRDDTANHLAAAPIDLLGAMHWATRPGGLVRVRPNHSGAASSAGGAALPHGICSAVKNTLDAGRPRRQGLGQVHCMERSNESPAGRRCGVPAARGATCLIDLVHRRTTPASPGR